MSPCEQCSFRTVRFLKNGVLNVHLKSIVRSIMFVEYDFFEIGGQPCPKLFYGSQTFPVETRVHALSHDFVRVHGRSPKRYRVKIRVRISNYSQARVQFHDRL